MSESELPEEFYDVTSAGHLCRAIQLREEFVRVSPLQFGLYAALELRNAIERLLFEYLVLIHGENVSKKMEKEYRAYGLRKRIESVEPDLKSKILICPIAHFRQPC